MVEVLKWLQRNVYIVIHAYSLYTKTLIELLTSIFEKFIFKELHSVRLDCKKGHCLDYGLMNENVYAVLALIKNTGSEAANNVTAALMLNTKPDELKKAIASPFCIRCPVRNYCPYPQRHPSMIERPGEGMLRLEETKGYQVDPNNPHVQDEMLPWDVDNYSILISPGQTAKLMLFDIKPYEDSFIISFLGKEGYQGEYTICLKFGNKAYELSELDAVISIHGVNVSKPLSIRLRVTYEGLVRFYRGIVSGNTEDALAALNSFVVEVKRER